MPTLSKAHFSCVYSANLLMKESSFSGMITLLGGIGSADVRAGPSDSHILLLSGPRPHPLLPLGLT